MYTKRVYPIKAIALWTRHETLFFTAFITICITAFQLFAIDWFRIPWTAIALIGTAVSFTIGFQNNSVYGRIWEARKIWGGIVNASRTFGFLLQDTINDELNENKNIKTLTYRHIAWITSLRYAMRGDRLWETANKASTNKEWGITPPESKETLEKSLAPYLSNEDLNYLKNKNNKSTALIYLQSRHLKKLTENDLLWTFSFLKLEDLLKDLTELQGKSERIKNFPFPRQYATINHYFMWLLLLLLPMALIPQFAEIGKEIATKLPYFGKHFVWFTIPFYTAVAWMFHTMERIGRTGENPFEGTSNDVPISTISRGIEIDLRQNLGETANEIPSQFKVELNVQW